MKNIRIYARSKFYGEDYNSSQKKWIWHKRAVDDTRLVVTYDGLPYGKFRAEVPRDWTLWTGGPIPVSADRYMVAYNGRFGTYLKTYVGSPKKEVPFNHGYISGNMPALRGGVDASSGWWESLYGFTSNLSSKYRIRFSAYIRLGQKWAWVHARWIRWRGKKYLQVTRVSDPWGKYVFLLDPRREFSISCIEDYGWLPRETPAGRLYVVPGTQIQGYSRVTGFFEPVPGVFYPKQIKGKAFDKSMKRFRTDLTIAVSKVTVNDPAVNDSTYVIQFPRGAIVRDLVTNKVTRIGGTPQHQLEELERDVGRARRDLAPPSTAKP
ncbi:MAG: hypothetical protein ACP5VQ_03275 [Phycisphaerae bacterium]